MSRCPFLSTSKEEVGCFKECCFYEGSKGEKCPFKQLDPIKKFRLKGLDEYDLLNHKDNEVEFLSFHMWKK
ncbi:hypothetical protein [Hathewaya limosa]|uniref:Metal-binding protein n=1 Tax=Hathewaya limosa TaxID=1536 RepID=A0ABU0JSU6_HATLI|nr:hypothetical protein [Hathewaya limosa]AWZ48096.1 hypothetical protein C3495_04385 [Clostridiaceae bacterium 14S0207]MDQ0479154.1 hypothetical protein [Hathewaya limosa]